MDIDVKTYVALSVAMFLEYAIWGAWFPVLAARLVGPLKLSGKQTGWIYATLPIACIFAPLPAGWLADQVIDAKWILIVAHLVGAVLLFLAARQERFGPLLLVMFCYGACYAATLPLVNAVLFAATSDTATQGKVFIWAPVAWALAGWTLSGWRMTRETTGDGSDCLYYAAGLSVLMALGCFLLPGSGAAAEQAAEAAGGAAAASGEGVAALLSNPTFLLFLAISVVVAGLMQSYFMGSAPFLEERGIASKHVPAAMALAQIAQALATWFLMGWMIEHAGFKWTLAAGAACWLLLYVVYMIGTPRELMAAAQPLHGLAYVHFIIVGQIFTDVMAPEAVRSTMQAVIFAATTGVGLFLGTQFAGFVMDLFKEEGRFQWRKIWAAPAAIMAVGVLALALLFHPPV